MGTIIFLFLILWFFLFIAFLNSLRKLQIIDLSIIAEQFHIQIVTYFWCYTILGIVALSVYVFVFNGIF